MFELASIQKPTVLNVLQNTMESGLGLDISKTSTGITIFDGETVKTYQCVIEYDEDSPFHWYLLTKALEDDLKSLLQGKHFDVIGIEDSIQGENYDTVRKLILLNSVIDKIIMEGNVTCDYFKRIGNTVWKKWLRTLKPGKKILKDKAEIEMILDYLDFPLVDLYRNEKNSVKEKDGYQDQLDSTGVLIGVGLERQNNNLTGKNKKKPSKLRIHNYSSAEELLKYHEGTTLTPINLGGDLKSSVKTFFEGLSNEDKQKKYYMCKDSLGSLGLEYGLADYRNGNHIVMYHELK
ncbi:hypothetical protein P4493_04765 [Bacillus thuringiensis]|uniref:Uncharacterized protein n=3 Tax=Bacillus thuringiensis TaxID=1428 RepID=A0A0B5NBZ6_BACTU|nr:MULTISPECIES: hypothetical protein [Bacillus]MEC2535855.1 hypothetical protein [Bacillus cereus]MED1153695.1 hypothetical protein [Bacillus paranthracis]OUB09430.1 hypothetical protein BK708_33465 [Bacillus thuringiensis serovar yunnanensis]AFQ30015.1 hypothetical protein BTF1_29572 [Bacillus thuringiensis HD-789]AJG73920.1 hypothetical protein BF38_5809 [Bacillus thuringiensis]